MSLFASLNILTLQENIPIGCVPSGGGCASGGVLLGGVCFLVGVLLGGVCFPGGCASGGVLLGGASGVSQHAL